MIWTKKGVFAAVAAASLTTGAALADTLFDTTLISSETAARNGFVELNEDGSNVGSLADGDGIISHGRLEIDDQGTVKLQLSGMSPDGDGFLLINQADTDGDNDRDYVYSAAFSSTAGEVDAVYADALAGQSAEDLLITVLLDDGSEAGVLDPDDTILAVPGFAGQAVEPESFEVEGEVADAAGTCPDATFTVDGTEVSVDDNTVYEGGSCDDLFTDGVQVKAEGTVDGDTHLAEKVEIEISDSTPDDPGAGNVIFCVAGEKCLGTSGDDIIHGTEGNDEIDGGNGNDTIYGHGGDDKIKGGNGDDTLEGGDGDDELDGGNGNDTLFGDAGDDELKGGNGTDTLDGGAGADEIDGGNGPDTIVCDDDDKSVKGGRGPTKASGCKAK